MSIENSIFDEEITGSSNLDRDTAAAAELIHKVATARGVDPDTLTEENYDRLFKAASGSTPEPITPEPTSDQAGVAMPETQNTTKVANVIDVTYEMNRRAELLGVKIASLTPAQYGEQFKILASRMADMGKYAQECAEEEQLLKQAAEQSELEKQADIQSGRYMAQGFAAEVQKLASEGSLPPWMGKKKEEGGSDEDHGDDDKKKKEKDEAEKKAALEAHDRAVIAAAEERVKQAGLDTAEFRSRLSAALEADKTAASIHAEAAQLLANLGYKS
jgi:hypothetical protein